MTPAQRLSAEQRAHAKTKRELADLQAHLKRLGERNGSFRDPGGPEAARAFAKEVERRRGAGEKW